MGENIERKLKAFSVKNLAGQQIALLGPGAVTREGRKLDEEPN